MKKPSNHITHAHDRFFKAAMANKQVAKEFFEAELPADLLPHVDLNNLEMQPGSYIDDMRKESIADILYKTTIAGHEAYLYLLVDHQSKPDRLMPVRMLRYTCNILTHYLRDHKTTKAVPFVLPLVVYHGEKKWSYSTDINALVDAPKEVVDAYFLKPFSLVDLTTVDDEILKQRMWFGMMALTLKHIFNPDITPYAIDIIKLSKEIEGAGGRSFVEITLQYILDRGERLDEQAFFEAIQTELSSETGEKLMTLSERWRQEGWQKGLEKGQQKGLEEGQQKGQELVAKHMLLEGLDLEYIARLTDLSIDRVKALQDQNTN